MKEKTKRFLSLLLALCLLLTAAPLSWLTDVDWHFPDFSKLFSVASHAATIVDSGNCGDQGNNVKWTLDSDGLLTISGKGKMLDYNYDFEPMWFSSLSIQKVTIQSGVTSIGNMAFYGCENLTTVTIGNSVTTIGELAFYGCEVLTTVTIGNHVKSIGDHAFKDCRSLTSVKIPDSVTSLGYLAFFGCSKLKTVTIGEGITSIAGGAFQNCSSLTGVTIPNGVISIENSAFRDCKSLASVTIPDSVELIQDGAFRDCTSLKSVKIPDSVTTIESSAFYGCTGLTNLTLGKRVVGIYPEAFGSCENLTHVTIPDSVEEIGDGAFRDCTSLKNVKIGNGVTTIRAEAFMGCGLTDVTIPDSVEMIGENAFINTPWDGTLCEEALPDSVVYAGKVAYGYKGVDPENTSIQLMDGTTGVAFGAFFDCTWLTSVTLPDSVKAIGELSFKNCSSLKRIKIPDSVWGIWTGAFQGCTGLTRVTLPDSASIGAYAFQGCTGLTSVEIGNNAPGISDWAFADCTGITYVTIPASVKYIGENAFFNCNGLEDVYYSGSENDWVKISGFDSLFQPNVRIHYNSKGPGPALPEEISALYPANGEKAFDFVNEKKLEITFNNPVLRNDASPLSKDYSAKLNFAAGTITIYNAETNKVVWQATENIITHLLNEGTLTVSAANPKTLLIDPGKSLDSLTDYYVTLDPGFVCLDTKKTSPGIAKGEWKFKTQWVSGITFKDSWFNQTSEGYQHELAQLCSQFVTIGYYKKDQVKNALELAGFTVNNANINLSTGRDQMNYFIARKDIQVNGQKKPLIFCGFIGSHKMQWNSNFDPYGTKRSEDSKAENLADPNKKGIVHLGFEDARTFVINKIGQYLHTNGISASEAKFLITGHSRGAATANLVAADMIRGTVDYAADGVCRTFTCNADDVYTYTFATPNNIKAEKISDFNDPKFDRIYNIVNPQDFVTYVLPTNWGFSKYGKTLLLPTKDNVGPAQYKAYNANMLKYFAKLLPGTTFADYEEGEVTTYEIVTKFTDNVNGLDEFYGKDILAYMENVYGASLIDFPKYKKPFEYFKEVLCPFVNKTDSKAVAANIALKIETTHVGLYADFTTFFIQNSLLKERFNHAHTAETYCAYMMTLSSEIVQDDKSSKYYKAHCPVDIEIYDKETGELVGRTVNNVVDETVAAGENAVVIEVEGDEKSFMLPDSINYEIKYIPYDEGKMDLTVASIGYELTETARVNFYEVPLTPGVVYDSVSESDAALSNYVLTAGGDKEIKPDQVLTAEEAKQFTVTVRNENGEDSTENTLYVTEGDYATVTPILPEGMLFAGWYNGETLISTEEAYRFRPTGDITLTARFKPAALPGDVSGDGKVTAEDARLSLRAAVGLETYEAGSPDFLAADASHDGAITSEDARLILRAAVGLETLT